MSAIYERIAALNLTPLWQRSSELLPLAPTPSAEAERWRYADVRLALEQASGVMTAAESDRRVLLLVNPGLEGTLATTETLLAGVQMLLPGERARAHRHTAAVVRFIIEGEGACTVTDGRRVEMHPGDVVLTPSWAWHDHASDAPGAVVWLDCLDLPLVRALEAGFFELFPREHQDVRAAGAVPAGAGALRHPWRPVRDKLDEMAAKAAGGGSRSGEAGFCSVEYQGTVPGTALTPTVGCRAYRIGAGHTSRRRRETASSICYVISGEGTSLIGDSEVRWSEGDIFAVPGWAELQHASEHPRDPAYLLAMTDEPALRSLGLYRRAEA